MQNENNLINNNQSHIIMKNTKISQKERIDRLALELDMSVRKLAKFVGVSMNTLYKITDNSRYNISERTATKICNQLKEKQGLVINKEWLLTGEGEMILERLPLPLKESRSAEKPAEQNIDWRKKYYTLREEYYYLLEKYVKLLERRTQSIEKQK